MISAIASGLIVHVILRGVPKTYRSALQWTALGLTVSLEVFGLRTLALHRQVPQRWGHRYGPVAAAARYGLRMGIGPATILTSWFWWTGEIISALASAQVIVLCSALFAGARFATMYALAWRNPSGVEMSHRIRRVEAWRLRSRVGSIALMLIAALAVILQRFA